MEYDLANSSQDDLQLLAADRIEQSAIPLTLEWYPSLSKEPFIMTANDQVGNTNVGATYILYTHATTCHMCVLAPVICVTLTTAHHMCVTLQPLVTCASSLRVPCVTLTHHMQYKLKLYNATTKMCRKTLLGPLYGSPLRK